MQFVTWKVFHLGCVVQKTILKIVDNLPMKFSANIQCLGQLLLLIRFVIYQNSVFSVKMRSALAVQPPV